MSNWAMKLVLTDERNREPECEYVMMMGKKLFYYWTFPNTCKIIQLTCSTFTICWFNLNWTVHLQKKAEILKTNMSNFAF